MERLGNYLRRNIPYLQQLVERKLDVELGKIDVLPIPKYLSEWTEEIPKNFTPFEKGLAKIIGICLMPFLEILYAAKAGNSTIYYSRSSLGIFLSKKYMAQLGAHELVHIAHRRLSGRNTLEQVRVPNYIMEGFAEYIAVDTLKDMGLEPVRVGHRRELRRFKKELSDKGIEDYDAIKEFVLSF